MSGIITEQTRLVAVECGFWSYLLVVQRNFPDVDPQTIHNALIEAERKLRHCLKFDGMISPYVRVLSIAYFVTAPEKRVVVHTDDNKSVEIRLSDWSSNVNPR